MRDMEKDRRVVRNLDTADLIILGSFRGVGVGGLGEVIWLFSGE